MFKSKLIRAKVDKNGKVNIKLTRLTVLDLSKIGYLLASSLLKEEKGAHLNAFIRGMEVAVDQAEEKRESDDKECSSL